MGIIERDGIFRKIEDTRKSMKKTNESVITVTNALHVNICHASETPGNPTATGPPGK